MSDDMRRDLADMLKAKGADDAGVAKMLGLVDDFAARVRAEDRARDDALGLLVYQQVVHYPGSRWVFMTEAERAPFVAAAKAVEDALEDELEEVA